LTAGRPSTLPSRVRYRGAVEKRCREKVVKTIIHFLS
jgi:hypothetical protein